MGNLKVVSVNKDELPTKDLVYSLIIKELEKQLSKSNSLSETRLRNILSNRGVTVNAKELISHVDSLFKSRI